MLHPSLANTILAWAAVLLAWFSCPGCSTTRTSDTSRTGMEQLLISNAIDQTLDRTPLPPVQGRKVFVDTQYLDSVDKGYLIGSVRQRLMNHGALLVDGKDASDVTIELRSGGVGTDNVSSFVGMPHFALPGPLPLSLPEIRLYEKNSQFGTAKLGLVAYETESGNMLFDSGQALARASDNRWAIMGVGPFQSGEVRDEVNQASQNIDFTTRISNTVDPFKKRK